MGIIGYGYWGPNVVRNFYNNNECIVKYICDGDENACLRASEDYPETEIINDPDIIFSNNEIDIVSIVTPVSTHYDLTKKALEAGKHVFVEKPMVQTIEQSDKLIRIAEENNLVGAVDHTFLFTGAVIKIKEIVESGELGELIYFDSTRINLGMFQHDINVIWDLAPHDLSILYFLTDLRPISLTSNGVDHLNNGLVDTAYLTLKYKNKMIANFHMNWLSPVKIRRIIIGGSNKMLIFDDMEPSEKIKIYDKGIEVHKPEEIHNLLVKYRSGNISVPNISNKEALKFEIENFIDNIKSNKTSFINDFKKGRELVKVLIASDQSLKENKSILLS